MTKYEKINLGRKLATIVLPGVIALSSFLGAGYNIYKFVPEAKQFFSMIDKKAKLCQEINAKIDYQKIREFSQNPNCFKDYSNEIKQKRNELNKLEKNSLPNRPLRGMAFLGLGTFGLIGYKIGKAKKDILEYGGFDYSW